MSAPDLDAYFARLGYTGSRTEDLFGFEAVLADGSEHRPDPAWFSPTGVIPAGMQVDPLFVQSGLAVVTAAHLRLRRRQEYEAAIVEHRAVHLGIATDTESGLMVPVIQGCDGLGVLEIAREIAKAHCGTIRVTSSGTNSRAVTS